MAKKKEPWWLTDATETCPACSQSYAYHTEIRCLECDGPLCPICVQVTTAMEFSCVSAQRKNVVKVESEEREPGKVIDLVAVLKKSLAGKG